LRRLKPEPKVLAFVVARPLDQLYISAVTLAELRFGIELLSEGRSRRDELNKVAQTQDKAYVRQAGFAG
jgi:predicted nucleic acid-binding protein